MEKIEKTSAYKKSVYNRLKQAIISREFKPGDLLNERKLASELDVSRTPVREAIQMLENESWVAVVPWKGAVVLPVTKEDIEELFQLRMAIEPMVMELVTHKLENAEIAYLETLIERQKQLAGEDDGKEFISIDQDFHLFLANLTGNRRLREIMVHLRDIHLRLGVEAVQERYRYKETLEEHTAIVEALKRRDGHSARQAMLTHMVQTRRALLRHVDLLDSEGGKTK